MANLVHVSSGAKFDDFVDLVKHHASFVADKFWAKVKADQFCWCVDFERNINVGRLRYEIINSESEDVSDACDWLKFDVHLD